MLIRNVSANLISGAAGAVMAVVLPPFLVRNLDKDSYSIWVLLLQLGGYTSLLNLGLQTAIGRFVAQANSRNDFEYKNAIISTAFGLLACSAFLGILLITGLVLVLPHLFPAIPISLQSEARIGLIWVGGSLALGLPFSAVNGIFVGMQRNEIPAAVNIVSRTATALGLVLAATRCHSLVLMAEVYAMINFLTYCLQFLALRRFAPGLQLSTKRISTNAFRELTSYCFGLTVMSFAMLCVSGLDLVLVARFDFRAVGAYAIASALLALLYGVQSAILNVLLPAGAALDANGDHLRLVKLLFSSTIWNMVGMGVALVLYSISGQLLLGRYIGQGYSFQVGKIISVLLLATVTRCSLAPYATMAISTGDHKRILLSPIGEGISNLIFSILLGWRFGAIGVAWGTFLGSIVGVGLHLAISIPRSKRLGVSLDAFLWKAFIPATLLILPWLFLLGVVAIIPNAARWHSYSEMAIASILSMIVILVSRPIREQAKFCSLVKIRRFIK